MNVEPQFLLLDTRKIMDDDQCEVCENRCKHGYCDCSDDVCPDCYDEWNLEQEAEREANWQTNVIGPMFGWK